MFPNKKPVNKNLYIKLLEYGDNHPNGFKYQDLINQVNLTPEEKNITDTFFKNSFSIGETEDYLAGYNANGGLQHHIVLKPIQDSVFICLSKGNNFSDNSSIYILKYDAYFNYIGYMDLKSTQFISLIALGLSLFGIGLSIYFSTKQINISEKQLRTPTEIKQSQIQEIKESIESVYYFGK